MKPPAEMPTEPPFLTFLTPTFRRPNGLNRCLISVWSQTAIRRIEQIVLPDHLGLGVANGLYGRMPWYKDMPRGRYVHVLCDDDALAGPTVAAQVEMFAEKQGWPEVIIVRAHKGALELPVCPPGLPPEPGEIDLSCYVIRRDIWQAHVNDYGLRYEGDLDHVEAMVAAGRRFEYCNVMFVDGDARNGRPEVEYA